MKLSKLRASTSMRKLAGRSVPRENTTSFGMRAALKKAGNAPYAGESGDVEGSPAKVRLDRARRHGGRVKKVDGGGISKDSKLEAYRLRREDDKDNTGVENFLKSQAPAGLGLATLLSARSKIAKGIGAGLVGLGASNLPDVSRRINRQAARREEIDRIEKGLVKPGEEDRKFGGRVRKRAHGGRVKKADGGPAGARLPSRDSRDEVERLREDANVDVTKGIAGSVAGTLGGNLAMMRRKGPGALGMLLPAGGLGYMGKKLKDSWDKRGEASRIEKGLVKEGEEDRKRGGRVKLRKRGK